jgi:23S rRNA pseudouridine1911/1915/1917 synthase
VKQTVPAALNGQRVDRVVALLTDLSRTRVAELVAEGAVSVAGRTVTSRSRRVTQGEELEVALPDEPSAPTLAPNPGVASPVVNVVHADDEVIVVDKPAGLVVHPAPGTRGPTLVHGLLARFPDLALLEPGQPDRPGIVHRLDKGTSGLLVVARTAAAHRSLVSQLRRRSVDRRYLALVCGRVDEAGGVVDAPVGRAASERTRMAVSAGGRAARTHYQVVERFADPPASLLECRLETGRTHQVRVHMAAIGRPIVGDVRYGGRDASVLSLERPFLHAHELSFDHPATAERRTFSSELPADLEEILGLLREARL